MCGKNKRVELETFCPPKTELVWERGRGRFKNEVPKRLLSDLYFHDVSVYVVLQFPHGCLFGAPSWLYRLWLLVFRGLSRESGFGTTCFLFTANLWFVVFPGFRTVPNGRLKRKTRSQRFTHGLWGKKHSRFSVSMCVPQCAELRRDIFISHQHFKFIRRLKQVQLWKRDPHF